MLENIPSELRARPQWVAASGHERDDGTLDKIPLNPRTGHRADVTDAETWGTFDDAVRSGHKFIGYVLSDADPFTIIDLDDKAHKPASAEEKAVFGRILKAFQSYAEVSASGRGVHIIVRGAIPRGIKRGNVEMYSTQRYMICTGNKINDLPISERQELLDKLFIEMANAEAIEQDIESGDATMTDAEIVEMGLRAANGEKFSKLTNGEIDEWPSQSEADLALLSMLCYYTRDDEQVTRIFLASPLGKRDKAQRKDYIPRTIKKVRKSQPQGRSIMLSFIDQMLRDHDARAHAHAHAIPVSIETDATKQHYRPTDVAAMDDKPGDLEFYPPGLVGDIARYIYSSAIRPVPEVALAAALGIMSGVCGRSWNISGTGLNQYIIVLAETGTGKEGAKAGIDSLMAAIRRTIPMVDSFIGPGAFASGQALIRSLDENHAFVSILGEFGHTLKAMCDPRANGGVLMLRRVLLDLYTKSGATGVLRSSAYADTEKNTKTVFSPAFSLLGDSTPSTFFDELDLDHVSDGLIPRFTVIEYKGERPDRNKGAGKPPPDALVSRFADVVVVALNNSNTHHVNPVHCDSHGLDMLDRFDAECTKRINGRDGSIAPHLWNRAHLKALKLSALIAVGVNKDSPVITEAIARWAIAFVSKEVQNVLAHFEQGGTGVGEHRMESDLRRAWDAYTKLSPETRNKQYQVARDLAAQPRLVPLAYLRARLRLLKSFKDDRRGASTALESLLASMMRAEIIEQIPRDEAFEQFGTRAPVYTKGPAW